MPKAAVDFKTVTEVGLNLPDVVDGSTALGTALRVHGRLLACKAMHKSAEPNTLMVRVSVDDRDRLLAENPKTYYLTEHYRRHSAVLVRLSGISRSSLEELLGCSWQFVFEKAVAQEKRR